MALELTRLGFAAADTGEIAGWETATGVSVRQPEHATDEWLLSHLWVWNRRRPEETILLESRMRGNAHIRFGRALGESDPPKGRNPAPGPTSPRPDAVDQVRR